MLRISPIASDNHHIILRLEGRVVGPWVPELSKVCEQALGEGQALELNLAEVSYVDRSGVLLINDLRSQGISLVECSPFVEEQLKDRERN
jgi:ABC-type transporter Mla MlaB component